MTPFSDNSKKLLQLDKKETAFPRVSKATNKRDGRTFTDEFKHQMVQLYLNGKRKSDIVEEYDRSATALDRWVKKAPSTGSFREKDNRIPEEAELIKLRKENRQLKMDIAIALFI